jgi:acetylornithine deacetylase/succinyl-diaminopimelate desuccinylase-like protein
MSSAPAPAAPAARVQEHISRTFDRHLGQVRRFVRQVSISGEDRGIGEMADLVAARLREIGARAEVIATARHPVVYGEIDAGAPRTLLLYGMYDVQPVVGERWSVSDPFGAELVEGHPQGPSIVARGVYNSKGPLACFLNVLESIREVEGRLPLNVRFMIEGEEELGSPSLPAFVTARRASLAADAGYFPGFEQDATGNAVLRLGCKGELFFELVCRGGAWGGPTRRAVHGSTAVWYASPPVRLAQAIASMFSLDQRTVTVEGFRDGAEPPGAEDEGLLAALAGRFDPRTQLETDEVRRFTHDLWGVDLLRKYVYEPSLNVDGIVSGHPGEGTKTILPHEARAKMDVRFVPRMRADRVVRRLRDHLDRHGLGDIELRVDHAFPWSKVSVTEAPVRAMVETCRELGFEPEIWPLQASSAPFYLLTDELGMPFVTGGLGHGARAHSADEYATVAGMELYERGAAIFLYRLREILG